MNRALFLDGDGTLNIDEGYTYKTNDLKFFPDVFKSLKLLSKKFVEEAQKEFDIDLSKSFVIGDHPHDVKMGSDAGCKAVYLLTCHGQKHKNEVKAADFIAENLYGAARWILNVKDRV